MGRVVPLRHRWDAKGSAKARLFANRDSRLEARVLSKAICREDRRRKRVRSSGKEDAMKIIWRNPNAIAQRPVSIVSAGSFEESGQVQRFYRRVSGFGILGTKFELWMSCGKSARTAQDERSRPPGASEGSQWALLAKPALQLFW
jgi:hypothetical protein